VLLRAELQARSASNNNALYFLLHKESTSVRGSDVLVDAKVTALEGGQSQFEVDNEANFLRSTP
jgi:hypothetical protein